MAEKTLTDLMKFHEGPLPKFATDLGLKAFSYQPNSDDQDEQAFLFSEALVEAWKATEDANLKLFSANADIASDEFRSNFSWLVSRQESLWFLIGKVDKMRIKASMDEYVVEADFALSTVVKTRNGLKDLLRKRPTSRHGHKIPLSKELKDVLSAIKGAIQDCAIAADRLGKL